MNMSNEGVDAVASNSASIQGGTPYPTVKETVSKKSATMTMLALAMMNIAQLAGVGNDVQMAFYGLSSVTYYILGAIFFFIPTALVAAELATTWSRRGGIFRWVGEALGPGTAFFLVFTLWFFNALNFGGAPASGAATIMFFTNQYNFAIQFAQDPIKYIGASGEFWIMIGWLIFYWILIILSTKGIKIFSKVASIGITIGTIIPLGLMIIGIIFYVAMGHKIYINFNASDLIPQYQGMSTLALAASVFFSYAGIDMNAAYIKQLKNPRHQFPQAIIIAMAGSLFIFMVGTLIIAMIVPEGQMNVLYTLNQVFEEIGAIAGMPWLYIIIAYMGLFNTVAGVITGFAGPSFMLGAAGRSGFLPKWLQNVNKHGMPSRLMIVQGILMTIISFMMELFPNIEGFSIMLTQALTVLYLIYYIIMFISFIRLKYTQPNRPRGVTCPGGIVGAWIVTIIGLLSSLFGIVMSIWPPAQVSEEVGSPQIYVWSIIIICLVCIAIPYILYAFSVKARTKAEANGSTGWADPDNKFAPFTWQIEGFDKPSKSLSNIPVDVLSYDQNPMGLPIRHPFTGTSRLEDLPQLVVDNAKIAAINESSELS
ncbi:MAG: amino acid permease [Aeriscardovia sp.]|nr:amino acid permease [Aeriscardovia sp.]